VYRIVSFGTAHPHQYRKGIAGTKKKCRALSLPYHMELIDPTLFQFRGWYGGVLYKPTFIKKMLHGYDQPIVYLDADCEVVSEFTLPEGDWDIGMLPHQILRNRIHFDPWVSSLLAFRPTDRAKRLLDMWERLCQWGGLRESDHERLTWILSIMEDEIRIQNLLPNLREKIYLDPRHRKRCKYSYEEIPKELDNWNPPKKELPEDKRQEIMERVRGVL